MVLLLVATAALLACHAPIRSHRMLYLVIAAPFLMFAAPIALLVLSWGRHWVLAGLATVLTLLPLAMQLPWYFGTTPHPDSAEVRVMTINMLYGFADAAALTRIAADGADILMAQELTPEAAKRLSTVGIDKSFPYRTLDPRPESAGVGVYSKYPIVDSNHIGGYQRALVSARVRIPAVAHPVSVLAVHFDSPWPKPVTGWQSDIAKFPGTLSDVAAQAGDAAVLIGGDFNATIDMTQFRQMLTNGYEDAARQAGSGRTFTYPSNKRVPPLIGIDHVLTKNATAVSTSTVDVPGTDHRALLATVMVAKA